MRFLIVMLLVLTVGCASWGPQSTYQKKRKALENRIEPLKLEKRKTILEIQIDELEGKMVDELR